MNFPNIPDNSFIGFDVETRDPGLTEEGPGWARGYGEIVGVSISLGYRSFYYPLRHYVEPEDNVEVEPVIKFLADVLGNPTIRKVGANLLYDVGWISEEGIEVRGPCYDVQYAEALLESGTRTVSLDYLAKKYLGKQKESDEYTRWCDERYKGFKDQRANIWRAPPRLVKPYAEADASLPLEIFNLQSPKLQTMGLADLFILECKLIPILVKMRRRGAPVDLIKAQEVRDELIYAEKLMRKDLFQRAGFHVNVNSGPDLAVFFDKEGIPYPRTAKGNPSFKGEWLEQQHHPAATMVKEIRKIAKARSTFVEKAILDKAVNGCIYPSLHPLRNDKYGTITGRFSSTAPNIQQVPARDEEMAPLIRGLFVPAPGFSHICAIDFSQIEYRMLAHFVNKLLGDTTLTDKYVSADTDFHQLVMDMLGVDAKHRKPVKNISFMKLYGGGLGKTAAMLAGLDLGMSARDFVKQYDLRFPQANRVMEHVENMIRGTNEIRTILNRRTVFNKYVHVDDKDSTPLPYSAAIAKYGQFNIEIAGTYKGLNYLLQGSAADYMKSAMVLLEESGMYKKIGYPHATVHDELTWSYHPDLRLDFLDAKSVMENAIPLSLPMMADAEIGPTWGDCHIKL